MTHQAQGDSTTADTTANLFVLFFAAAAAAARSWTCFPHLPRTFDKYDGKQIFPARVHKKKVSYKWDESGTGYTQVTVRIRVFFLPPPPSNRLYLFSRRDLFRPVTFLSLCLPLARYVLHSCLSFLPPLSLTLSFLSLHISHSRIPAHSSLSPSLWYV